MNIMPVTHFIICHDVCTCKYKINNDQTLPQALTMSLLFQCLIKVQQSHLFDVSKFSQAPESKFSIIKVEFPMFVIKAPSSKKGLL